MGRGFMVAAVVLGSLLASTIIPKPADHPQLQSWLQPKWVTSGKQTQVNSRKRRSLRVQKPH